MKPAPFKYFKPTTVEQALDFVADQPHGVKLLAGGQSLIPTLNFRLAQPAVLIDISEISTLDYIKAGKKGGVSIGAMTRQRKVEKDPLIVEHAPLLHETMPHLSHIQIRSRGTIGGSIVHSDPAAELPAVMVARQASFRLQSKGNERWVKADDFFTGLFATALQSNEILTEIVLPAIPKRSGWSFMEISRQRGDFALVATATVLTLDKKQRCQEARIVFVGVGEGPVSAVKAAEKLIGHEIDAETIAAAAELAAKQDVDPSGDLHASKDYRRQLVEVLAKRTLHQAWERAQANNKKSWF